MLLNIQYKGEHLLPGTIGQSFIYFALLLAFLSFIFYLFSELRNNKLFHKVGKSLYILHFSSLVIVGISFFYILVNHYFEYAYVWEHTASYLPLKYIISAFWAGQEGSFLLWVIIQGLLGIILLFTAKKFAGRVMTVISGAQLMLTTMILGIKPLGLVLGQSPFVLLREKTANIGAEFFSDPNYLSQILDGNGINPLLENIWMVTHPPLLFLGYSAALIPFSYAIASLWKSDYKSWLRPAFPWTIFAVMSLGGGILLGGAWAYESLTFGGFWAWDPVENASLIPWLVILASMHTIILNKRRNHSYGLSYLFVYLGFLLVIYASYLTRSGVLGETSAHAFGNNGLSTQMIAIMLIVSLVFFFLYFKNFKKYPSNNKDEFLSREFWMYIGSLILVLSAFQILISTSIPVINTVFGSNIAPPPEREAFYNKWQLPFAVIIMILTSVSLVLKYAKNNFTDFIKEYGLILIIANVLFITEIYIFQVSSIPYLILLLSANIAIIASIYYTFKNKFDTHSLSNSLSHLGFSIFILGVLIAFSTSEVISSNTSTYDLGDKRSNKENQLLVRGQKKQLKSYQVEYTDLKREKNHLYYGVDFYQKDKNGKLAKAFHIEPSINVNNRMGNVYDPETYHSFSKDVFTYITYADIKSDLKNEDYKELFEKEVKLHDTLLVKNISYVLDSIVVKSDSKKIDVNNIALIAKFKSVTENTKSPTFELKYEIKNGMLSKSKKEIENIFLHFNKIIPKTNSIIVVADEKRFEFIVIKSTVFPYISLMWIGVLIMFLGLGISLIRNIRGRILN